MAHSAALGRALDYRGPTYPYLCTFGVEFILNNETDLTSNGSLTVPIVGAIPTNTWIDRMWIGHSWNFTDAGGEVTVALKTDSGATTLFSLTATGAANTSLITEELYQDISVVTTTGLFTMTYDFDVDALNGLHTHELMGWIRVVPTDI